MGVPSNSAEYVCLLYLKNHWVTLQSWVCHLKCSLCLLVLPKESLADTVLTDVCLRSLRTKKALVFFAKNQALFPKNLTLYWAPKDGKGSSIIEEVFARVNKFGLREFQKVQKRISIIIAHKHCHLTPGV